MQPFLEYISDLKAILDKLPAVQIEMVTATLHEARLSGRQIFIMGNGESASIVNSLSYDLGKNTRLAGLPGIRVINLSDNATLYSGYVIEESLDLVFSTQLDTMLNRGDVVIGFSVAGDEVNIIRAMELSNRRGANTIGITGLDGGRLGAIVDINLSVPATSADYVYDLFLIVCHIITRILRENASQAKAANQLERQYPEIGPIGKVKKPRPVEAAQDVANRPSERSRSSLELFSMISRELALELELSELLRRVLKLTLYNLKATSGSILVLNERGQVIESAMAYNGDIHETVGGQITEIVEKGLAGWVMQNRKAALIYNTRDDPRWLPRSWDREGKSRSAVSVPLMENEKVIGVLTLVNSQGSKFTEEDLSLLITITVFISLVNYSV